METIPAVAGADVTTSWPSTVIITVRERVAVGVLREDGRLLLVDRAGARYRRVATRPAGLPLLAVSGGQAARAAAGPGCGGDAGRRCGIGCGRSRRSDPTAITVVLRSGTLVRWGSSARNGLKARVVEALRHRNVDQIDVTDPRSPVHPLTPTDHPLGPRLSDLRHVGVSSGAPAAILAIRVLTSASTSQADITLTVYLRVRVREPEILGDVHHRPPTQHRSKQP